MLKLTNLTILIPVLLLVSIKLVFSQQPAIGQVCYMQRENGSTLDLTNLCRLESKPPALTTLEKENQRLVSLKNELQGICTQFPERCRSEAEKMNELSRLCSSSGRCPNSILQALQEYARMRNLRNP